MARTANFTRDELDRAARFRDRPKDRREYRAGLLVLLAARHGLTRARLADAFCIDVKTVFNDMKLVRGPDPASPKNARGGRRNCLMSLEEERQFLREHRERNSGGPAVSVSALHAAFNERVGKVTPVSTVYRLLKRHERPETMKAPRLPKSAPGLRE
jgi:hypothetical protein